MISNPSRLSDDQEVLVIDASVAINLLGTGRPAEVFRMLNRKVLIDERALEVGYRMMVALGLRG